MLNTNSDIYKTISNDCAGIFKDKGSKFLAFGYPISSDEDAKMIINELKKKYHDARHHCFAYRINPENPAYRVNDDGEPSGTAGKPIYGQILSNELFNVLIVVVRYFGGTLLGTSGLINAYKNASADCIINASVIEKKIESYFELSFPYEKMNMVMRVLKEVEISIHDQDFEMNCMMKLSIRKNLLNKTIDRLDKIENVTINIKNL